MVGQTTLRRIVQNHAAVGEQERAHLAAMQALLDAPGDPCARDHFEPGHFTASAFVLSPDGERVLLIHHGKLHRWLQPGGHLDPTDPDVVAAAVREVAEETGLEEVVLAPGFPELLDVDVHEIPPNPRRGEPAHRHFDLRVLLWATSEVLTAGSDAHDARWVPLSEVADWETDASVLRAVERLQDLRARARGAAARRAPAAERNREPICEVLGRLVPPGGRVLEVASGTGQHAVWCAARLPVRWWQPSDIDPEALQSVEAWRRASGVATVRPVTRLDVLAPRWQVPEVDLVFCANLVHISPWACTEGLLAGAARQVGADGRLVLYGPFRRQGVPTATSNEAFDASLRARDPSWGVRELERVVEAGASVGWNLEEVVEMPANNVIVVLGRTGLSSSSPGRPG